MEFLRGEMPDTDYRYKAARESPKGKKCLFPAIAYQLDFRGIVTVGYMRKATGSFFADRLPALPVGPIPCPRDRCRCLDMYSFLGEVNRNVTLDPLHIYSDQLRVLRSDQGPV